MPYFVFDLDETLGNLHTPHYFLYDLRRETTRSPTETSKRIATSPPPELAPYIDTAYMSFVHLVAQQEQTNNPLGILRPGMIQVFQKLAELKQQGLCEGVAIYSNNGCLSNLHFARDVLHAAIGRDDLICDCIHWHHPFRQEEYIKPLQEGAADKTWKVLQKILIEGDCHAPKERVTPSNLYFFDDQEHPDLENVLQDHYIHMNEYPYKASFSRVANLYKESLYSTGIMKDPSLLYKYVLYTSQLYPNTRNYNPKHTIGRHLQILRELTGSTSMVHAPPPDESILRSFDVLETLSQQQESTTQTGGRPRAKARKTRKAVKGKQRDKTK